MGDERQIENAEQAGGGDAAGLPETNRPATASLAIAVFLLPWAICVPALMPLARNPDPEAVPRLVLELSISALALVAVVLGVIALIQIGKSREAVRGRLAAAAGIVLGVSISSYQAVPLMGYAAQVRVNRQQKMRWHNMLVLSMAMQDYCESNGGRFPPAGCWNEALRPHVANIVCSERCESPGKGVWINPLLGDQKLPCYAMNRRLDGMSLEDVKEPDKTVVLFESVPGRNLAGGPELMLSQSRWYNVYVTLADGEVRQYMYADGRKLKWNPLVVLRTKDASNGNRL